MDRTTTGASLRSPFALMFPEALEEILERAEHMNLPRKRYSPLSQRAQWRLNDPADVAGECDGEDDLADIEVQSVCGRPEIEDKDEL